MLVVVVVIAVCINSNSCSVGSDVSCGVVSVSCDGGDGGVLVVVLVVVSVNGSSIFNTGNSIGSSSRLDNSVTGYHFNKLYS